MNICIVAKYAPPPKYSKISARLFYLAKEFIKLGHKTTLVTSDSNHLATFPSSQNTYNYEVIDDVPLWWIRTKKYTKTASINRVLSWLDFERKLFMFDTKILEPPDVVIVSSISIFTILYGWYLKKKYNATLVFEIRDIWPLTMVEEGGFSKWHPFVLLLGLIEKFGYKKADLVVGTMPKLDLHVKNILGYNKPFFCSPLGFNFEDYKAGFLNEKNPFDDIFPKNKVIVGYAGSMGITNALENFIEAIRMLKYNSNIHFMLVGSGDLRLGFKKRLVDCKNVTFLPRLEQNKVKYFLKKCDILYLSTKNSRVWEYGQSMNKIVEYMLASKPIIASYAGFQSMLNEANCGNFVRTLNPLDVKNAILNMTNMSLEDRRKLGENGRKWIYDNRQYSKLAKEYIDAINIARGECRYKMKKITGYEAYDERGQKSSTYSINFNK
jgi:glycosyltransferase involved in cell wall biosynthesis